MREPSSKTRHPSLLMLLCLMLELFLLIMPSLCKGCFQAERAALLDFKAGIIDDPFRRLSSWKVDEDCCRWSGVVCDNQTGHVVELNLQNDDYYSSSALKVGFLNQSLLSLTHLDRLNLSCNDFGGTQIPEFMGSFPKLRYLDLSDSNFSGNIPPQLGNLSNLLYLDLDEPNYYGIIKVDRLDWLSGLSSLIYLNMDGVDLSEADHEWLPMVNMLPSLQELHLSRCYLETLTFSLSHENLNLTSLTTLDLSYNNFNSTLPTWLWQLSNLSYLDLSSNILYGVIPSEIGNLTSLTYLDLGWNQYLEIGGIAKSITNFSNLETLALAGNNLKGQLPRCLKQLTRLSHLDLDYNSLSGDLASWLLHMTTNYHNNSSKLSNLNYLDLSYNNLYGNLSELHFAKLTKLKTLLLSANSQLTMNSIDDDWIPPFQLQYIGLDSCKLGPRFPMWLHSQKSIMELSLTNTSIKDFLPDWFWNIFNSSNVYEIDLSHNNIIGTLPPSSESMIKTLSTLSLRNNLFQGLIPTLPPNLYALDLSSNSFSGPLLHLPSNLESLYLSNNHINGTIPSHICNMSNLGNLDLSHNQISGKIPQCWREEAPYLEYINLGSNMLSGEIPHSIGNLDYLKFLQLDNNSLHGHIPLSLQNCSNLAFLDLGNNKFSGDIPTWIGVGLPNLEVLLLRSNMFSGNIPPQIGQLSYLQIIDLANNQLSGHIPHSLGNLSAIRDMSKSMYVTTFYYWSFNGEYDSLDYKQTIIINTKGHTYNYSSNVGLVKNIVFSNNNLSGNIPREIGALSDLQNLNLSGNKLQGEIPSSIGNIKSLESLDLSFNKLSGVIPESLSQLNYLGHLNMSYNNFSGRIPSGKQLQTLDDPFIYAGNAHLCGFPLNKSCSIVDIANSTAEEANSEKLWQYVSIAMGFVVGLWSVFVILLFKKDFKFFYFRLIDKICNEIYVQVVVSYARFMRKLNGTGPEIYRGEDDCRWEEEVDRPGN